MNEGAQDDDGTTQDIDRVIADLFPGVEASFDFLRGLDPEFSRIWKRTIFGLYARAVLDQKTRELCAISALAMTGQRERIRTHVVAAHLAGATRAEIQEVIFQTFVFGGAPVVLGPLEVMVEVFAQIDREDPG
jgi:AhpD family alkylhydroperoxidase